MTKREPLTVLLLGLVTCGIYLIVWHVQVKEELNQRGSNIPTALLLLVPIANLWWMWEFAKGVEMVTRGEAKAIQTFLLDLLCGLIGVPITVQALNKVD